MGMNDHEARAERYAPSPPPYLMIRVIVGPEVISRGLFHPLPAWCLAGPPWSGWSSTVMLPPVCLFRSVPHPSG